MFHELGYIEAGGGGGLVLESPVWSEVSGELVHIAPQVKALFTEERHRNEFLPLLPWGLGPPALSLQS